MPLVELITTSTWRSTLLPMPIVRSLPILANNGSAKVYPLSIVLAHSDVATDDRTFVEVSIAVDLAANRRRLDKIVASGQLTSTRSVYSSPV